MRHRVILSTLLIAAVGFGQDAKQTSTYMYDVNGHRVRVSAPLQSVDEKILSSDANGRIVERLVKLYDANGKQTGTEKTRIEERNLGQGRSTASTSVYVQDINGSFALRERAVTESIKSGEVERSETRLERPSLSGGMDLAELRITVATGSDKERHTDVTTLLRDVNNAFKETQREIAQTKVQDNQTTVTTSTYNAAAAGKMALIGQTVARTTKRADGGESQVVDVFHTVQQGRVGAFDKAELKLREQHVIDKVPGSNRSLVETFSVRRADLDSGRLGPAVKVSETVCSGACLPVPVPVQQASAKQ